MSDHLDFIRIRGLVSGNTEVFQGAADGGSSVGNLIADTVSANLNLDPLVAKLDEIFMTGTGETPGSIMTEIQQRLADLAFVDAKIDFGFFKTYLSGRMSSV